MSESLLPQQRLALLQTLNNLPSPTFEALRYCLGAPHSVIPSETAPQGNRGVALLEWAESPVEPGSPKLEGILKRVPLMQYSSAIKQSGHSLITRSDTRLFYKTRIDYCKAPLTAQPGFS